MNFLDWYVSNRPIYKRLSEKVELILSEVFDMNGISYHIITSRAKDITSVNEKLNNREYENPKKDIQDFAGIRIITYVEDEIDIICEIIEKNFEIDKSNSSNKSDELGEDKVGYKSIHYVATLDKNRLDLPEYKQYIGKCFEIQVRTILQHAWAEIEHDRNYKFAGKLPPGIGRRFKILAGVLEMADREFNNISNEIDLISKQVEDSTKGGNLDISISSTSVSKYLKTKFSRLIDAGYRIIPDTDENLINEIEHFGINTLAELDGMISDNMEDSLFQLASHGKSIYESGLLRRILILNDYKKYFTQVKCISSHWQGWCNSEDLEIEYEFFKSLGVDWNDIEKKYGCSIV